MNESQQVDDYKRETKRRDSFLSSMDEFGGGEGYNFRIRKFRELILGSRGTHILHRISKERCFICVFLIGRLKEGESPLNPCLNWPIVVRCELSLRARCMLYADCCDL